MFSRLRSASAFTLIELLVVILIIGILIVVAAPSFLGQTEKAHDSESKQYLAVAYKVAKASTITETNAGSYNLTDVISAINGEGSGLTAVSGSCPGSTTTDPHYIVVETASGGNLTICNDPNHTVWTLTVVNHGPPTYTSSNTALGASGSESSGGVTVDVADPTPGSVTLTTGTSDSPPAGTQFIGPPFTISDPAPPAGDSVAITIVIDAGSVPDGADAPNIIVYQNGVPIADCTSAAPATPDPCVESKTDGEDGSVTIVVRTNGDSSDTYTITAPDNAGPPVDCNSASPPANDDFADAQVLSGSGSVNGTLCGSTVQTISGFPEADPNWTGVNDYNTLDDYASNAGIHASGSHSVWYKFTASAAGDYYVSTGGSAVQPNVHVYKSNSQAPNVTPIWPTNGDPFCDDCMYGKASAVDGDSTTGGFSLVADQVIFVRVVNPYGDNHGSFTLTYGPFNNTDFDNDDVTNGSDNCPNKYNPSQKDLFPAGGDGTGDACQTGLVIYNNTGYVLRGYTPPQTTNSYHSSYLYTDMRPTGEECSGTCYFANPASQVWHAENNHPYCSDNAQIQPYYHCVDTASNTVYHGAYDYNNPGTIIFVNDGWGTDNDWIWNAAVHLKFAALCEPDDNAPNCQDYNVPDPWVNGATNAAPVNSGRDFSDSNSGVEYLTFG